jgi:uncharacterized protein (TIGR02391 family)
MIEILQKLVEEGQKVLETKFEQDDGITVISRDPFTNEVDRKNHTAIINIYVNSDLFNKWYEKVKIFLKQNNYEDSIVKPSSFLKNFDITKQQLAKLNGILELQAYTTHKNIENSLWGYIPNNIKKLYDDGHYQQAVFEAYKYIEVIVRNKGNYPEVLLGTKLMRKAFDVQNGNLTNFDLPDSERQSQSDLYAGVIGFIKNPKSHHNLEVKNKKATELLYFANYLLRILDGDYSQRN